MIVAVLLPRFPLLVALRASRITSEEAAPVDVEPVHARHGASQVVLTDVTIEAPGPAKIGKGNKVSLNGKAMNETVKP